MMDLTKIPFDPSPNKSVRTAKIEWIIIHAFGGGTMAGVRSWFKNKMSAVSAHYLVGKDASVISMVKPEEKAWHVKNFNSQSLGIELEDGKATDKKANCLTDPHWMTEKQFQAAVELTATLCKKYNIPPQNIMGHYDKNLKILGNNHSDPGKYFPMGDFKDAVAKKYALLKDEDDE